MISLPPSWLQAGETGNFLIQNETHMYERRKPEDAAQAHHTTACSRFGRSTALPQIASASTLRQLRLHAER